MGDFTEGLHFVERKRPWPDKADVAHENIQELGELVDAEFA